MKKVLVLVAAALLFAAPAMATIVNSAHDLSGAVTNQVCAFCHAPHATVSAGGAPLWNRGTYDVTTIGQTYLDLGRPSFDATAIDLNQADIRLCLDCHDGNPNGTLRVLDGAQNVAVSGLATFTGNITNILDAAELTNDHPVGMVYDGTLVAADGALNDPTAAPISGWLAAGGYVTCASCHDVHEPGTAAAGTSPFLRTSNVGSALCTTCHIK